MVASMAVILKTYMTYVTYICHLKFRLKFIFCPLHASMMVNLKTEVCYKPTNVIMYISSQIAVMMKQHFAFKNV